MSILDFLSEVGVPIFGAVVMAFFIFLSMKYIFDYNTTSEPNDQILDFGKFTIHIDATSIPYLNNMTLDYVKSGINEEFKFINPNVEATCGCGVSMSF